ncbi:unnamed protein product [Hapterophycus canaliculatus]
MLEMIKVPKREQRLQGMLYKQLMGTRQQDLRSRAGLIKSACLDVRQSGRLKQLFGIILTLGNKLNDVRRAQTLLPLTMALPPGFTLDSLIQLHIVKASDRKTSVLQYLVKLVRRFDPALLDFKDVREGRFE